jgi:hypothetical protein
LGQLSDLGKAVAAAYILHFAGRGYQDEPVLRGRRYTHQQKQATQKPCKHFDMCHQTRPSTFTRWNAKGSLRLDPSNGGKYSQNGIRWWKQILATSLPSQRTKRNKNKISVVARGCQPTQQVYDSKEHFHWSAGNNTANLRLIRT